MSIIQLEGVSYKYAAQVPALENITVSIKQGDYVGIVGPNGSGKTTLVKIILGLLQPDSGSVKLFGKDSSSFGDWNKIGYLPQKSAGLDSRFPATAQEIIASGLPRGFSGKSKAIDKSISLLNIDDLRHRPIGKLSGGQQQRVLLARALVRDPSVLILDEPTTALDPQTREDFYAMTADLNKKSGKTIMLISHDSGSVGKYANKLLYVDRTLVFYGDFEDFCRSEDMTHYFGQFSQHLICHRHEAGISDV